ncbi:MAG: hypothetical protein WA421_00985, partial [Nitrososphaeraceae archaeon]
PRAYWKVLFSRSIKVTIGVPGTLPGLVRQQIRWKKSFLRRMDPYSLMLYLFVLILMVTTFMWAG